MVQPENEVYFKSGGPSALAPEAARAAANNLGRPKLRSQLVRLETGCSQVGVELAGLGGLGFTRRALQDGFCGIQTKRPAVASFLRIILMTKTGSEDFHSSSRLIFRWHGSRRRYPRSGSPMHPHVPLGQRLRATHLPQDPRLLGRLIGRLGRECFLLRLAFRRRQRAFAASRVGNSHPALPHSISNRGVQS